MGHTLLEVRDLKKHFKVKSGILHAVDGVSFTVEEGKTIGIVGESGCGKSTLGRVILHLHERTDGQIFFNGEDISDVSHSKLQELRSEMQMIFQDPFSSINPRKTVSSIIGEPMKIYHTCSSKAEYREKVLDLMNTVGLESRVYNDFPHELDGGKRQRIGIARALAIEPKFIIYASKKPSWVDPNSSFEPFHWEEQPAVQTAGKSATNMATGSATASSNGTSNSATSGNTAKDTTNIPKG